MRTLFLIFLLAYALTSFAQSADELRLIRTFTDKDQEARLIRDLTDFHKYQDSMINVILKTRGQERIITDASGRKYYAHYYDSINGTIQYITTSNVSAASSTNTLSLHWGGALGLNLQGQGMKVGVWEPLPIMTTHQELFPRAINKDQNLWSTAIHNSDVNSSQHATHVAGTIAAQGVISSAKGMAPEAEVWGNTIDQEYLKMAQQAAGSISGELLLSNHSYWVPPCNKDANQQYTIDALHPSYLGYYSNLSKNADLICHNYPWYLPIIIAGNARNQQCTYANIDGNYDLLSHNACSKNALTIGAVKDVMSYIGPQDVEMTDFSSWGPTDDGRIKPDLCGVGLDVYSSIADETQNDEYGTKNGTSMAAPNVTGSLLLVQQHYRNTHNGVFMPSCLLKALGIHTARECGTTNGPDYSYGWGLLNTAKCIEVINNSNNTSNMAFKNLQSGKEDTIKVLYNGGPFRTTICWTDPAFNNPYPPQLINNYSVLVNDLDIRVYNHDFTSSHKPWKLGGYNNFNAPAIFDDNTVDNVEQIVPNFPMNSGEVYYVVVSHKNTLVNNNQMYGIVITGAEVINTSCTVPNSVNANYSTLSNVSLTWSSNNIGVTYRLKYKKVNDLTWTYINTNTNITNVSVLPNQIYVAQVATICSSQDSSAYCSPFYFSSNLALDEINEFEYWFDDNYLAKQSLVASNINYATGVLTANLTSLDNGLHRIHCRARSNRKWSAVTSSFFMRGNGLVNTVKYWFDDYQGISNSQFLSSINWVDNLSTSSLTPGPHRITYTFQTTEGLWSSPRSDLFIKLPPGNNVLIAYRYWFNQAYPSKIDGVINPAQPVIALTPSNLTINASGASNNVSDTFHIQFLNDRGQWSSVMSHDFTDYSTIYIDMKALIEGYYSASNNEMNPVLFNQGERLTLTNEADSVDVKLYEATAPYNLKFTFKGVVNQQGNLTCLFPGEALGNSYYLSVKGRNAIEVWTNQPELISLNTTYDFTTSATQAYGANQVEVSPGIFAFYTGDINQDGVVDGLDYNDWENDSNNFAAGYFSTDLNGDGVVDGLDFIFWELNSNNFVGVVVP